MAEKHRFHWVKDVWPIKCTWQTLWEMSKIFILHTTSLSYHQAGEWNCVMKYSIAYINMNIPGTQPTQACWNAFWQKSKNRRSQRRHLVDVRCFVIVMFIRTISYRSRYTIHLLFQVNLSICSQREMKAKEIQNYREWNWIILWTIPFLAFRLVLSYCRGWEQLANHKIAWTRIAFIERRMALTLF